MNLLDELIEKIAEKRREKAEGQSNALKLWLPILLTILSLLFVGFGIYHLVNGVNAKTDVENNRKIEDILNNPGEAWDEWAQLWEIPGTTWGDLEEPFGKVQQDWSSRGLTISWDGMTSVFSDMKAISKTFDNFKGRLFEQIRIEFCESGAEDAMKAGIGAGTTLLVLGSILGIFLIGRAIYKGTYIWMFF